ncbi:hypothetical protein M758_3G125400 [Ceratodon purpureus]|nr:hypothetical protein M758_3G125400 [Ceratodon purpureus]
MNSAAKAVGRKALTVFAGRGGVRAAGELASGARASSSLADITVQNLESSYTTDVLDRARVLPFRHRQARFSTSFAGEVPKLTHVTTRSEHSAALAVEDDKGYESSSSMEDFVEVGHKLADAARSIILKYFRSGFTIIDKEDLSPVTIADRETEAAMCSILSQYFPDHAIFGEEGGLTMPEGGSDYVWVLDPIDGTKSFITGKPVFGTLISLLYKGTPVLGIIDQPVLGERWVGVQGQGTTLNGRRVRTRSSTALLKDAYLYTTSPHMFSGETEEAFVRVRNEVKIPLYGCDCYAYGLLASGHADLVIEHGLKPYDYLALVPVVEGAGGKITNWSGESLKWLPEVGEHSIGVLAAGTRSLHKAALDLVEERNT